ncbi:MAG: hypothetical protein ACRD6X_13920 [Pyrinomonadaceae bacterium]
MNIPSHRSLFAATGLVLAAFFCVSAQKDGEKQRVRTVSIPISIYTKAELEQGKTEELLQVETLSVLENNEPQQLLSIRSRTDVPLSLAILVQDDLSPTVNLNLRDISKFVSGLPKGSRVMVAYMRAGSLDVRQKFTDDLEKAAGSFRVIFSNSSSAPRSPYDGVSEALNRFDALPAGRRAILMISNGLDLSSGEAFSSPGLSNELQAAIRKAQRKNVAVYSIYASTSDNAPSPSLGVLNGQASLAVMADETGGRMFATGTITPINFEPFLRQLNVLLGRQFLLTYLSEHIKKGYYKVEVKSSNPEVKIEHPKGYFYR